MAIEGDRPESSTSHHLDIEPAGSLHSWDLSFRAPAGPWEVVLLRQQIRWQSKAWFLQDEQAFLVESAMGR